MATLVANIVEPDDAAFHQSLHCLPLDIIHLLRKKYKNFHWRSSHYTVTHVRNKNSNTFADPGIVFRGGGGGGGGVQVNLTKKV